MKKNAIAIFLFVCLTHTAGLGFATFDFGSVIAITEGNNLIYTANYGPHGEDWGNTGTNPTPFTWLGGYGVMSVDDGTPLKLYLTRYRLYSTTLNRFLSADPLGLGGGLNLYEYCGGDPLTYIDPLGLSFWGRVGNGLVGAGAGALTGAGTGAAVGAGIGFFAAGVGAAPGAGAGATAGAAAGALSGFIGGFLSGPDYSFTQSATSGAVNGALAGATGGAGAVGGVTGGMAVGSITGGIAGGLSSSGDGTAIVLGAVAGGAFGGLGAYVGDINPLPRALFNADSEIVGQSLGLYIGLLNEYNPGGCGR